MRTLPRALPYLLSWTILAALMIVGMTRAPLALYSPIDGEWAKWNVEAILNFSKIFDLSPYSMLAGMGSMYFPNLPWLNPGAMALALPIGDVEKNIVSYVIYGIELAASTVLVARAIGFSWLKATAAAQLYLYLLFPPFSDVFRIYDWYSAVPYFAHLTAALNFALVLLLACGRTRAWRRNIALSVGFLALFISGLLSAPFTFIFATPAYIAIGAALIIARRPSHVEWAWKIAALLMCVIFFFASGLLDYYLGTIATVGRTPTAGVAWDRLLSLDAWLRLFRDHPLCQDPRLLLCIEDRGAWLQIAALTGAVTAIVMRRGDVRTVAWSLIAYIGLAHIYAYPYQAEWLGSASVLSTHFLLLSSLSFIVMFAVFPFFALYRLIELHASAGSEAPDRKQLARLAVNTSFAVLLVVIIVMMFRKPYLIYNLHVAQYAIGAAAFAALLLAVAAIRHYCGRGRVIVQASASGLPWRPTVALSAFPIWALIHLSMGIRHDVPAVRDPSLRNYLHENASIEVGKPFRGYAATIWVDRNGEIGAGPHVKGFHDSARYVYGLGYFRRHYGETFTDADLWRLNIPTFEEYGEWSSVHAHAFALRLLAPAGTKAFSNYLRAFTIDADILRALGVRFVLTNADTIDGPAAPRGAVTSPGAQSVYLFEFSNVNLGTYSPMHFVKAVTANAIVERIRENKNRLDRVAVVSDDVPSTTAQARNVVMTIELDGIRVRAESGGPAHIVLPIQFSNCLVVLNGAAIRLARANLFQTLMTFDGPVDARIEFHFGLFANNRCRLQDGADNKALGL